MPVSDSELPGDETIQFGEHLIHLYPVLQILRGANMIPLVDHDPAHGGCAVLAGGAVPGLRRTAAMHGLEV